MYARSHGMVIIIVCIHEMLWNM